MMRLTLALRLQAQSLGDCVQLLADDPELLAVARRYRGWLLPNVGEKNLIGLVDALLAEQAICSALGGSGYSPPANPPTAWASTLVLKISLAGGCDRELCAVFVRYQGCKTFGLLPASSRGMRLICENPELLSCFSTCQHNATVAC